MLNTKCPHCERNVTIVDEMLSYDRHMLDIKNEVGQLTVFTYWTVCPNDKCLEPSLTVAVYKTEWKSGYLIKLGKPIVYRRLIPGSAARTFPDFVPEAIREDYQEACAIVADSPKAAATLARRVIQGILRDFYGVKPGNLAGEIKQLDGEIDEDIYESIETVRKVGNIGAHMEKDIDVIVAVDEGEAELLIQLVETLIEDCYIARNKKQTRLGKLKALGQAKKEELQEAKAAKAAKSAEKQQATPINK